ncbi:MAG: 6-carboxytetrahydropterin synthase [Planctomycetes bacterium]|nr:6-carboxytetrahydropterin synthase [Planctomycetota bacterium]
MERWAIDLQKEAFKFSAAHFLIFPDGSAERLHGHNYRVFVELEGQLTSHGLVMDFKAIKPVVRAICDELDEHWIVPGRHPVLRWSESGGSIEVVYLDRFYRVPREDVIVLAINNTSSENLATWFGRELAARIAKLFPDVRIARMRLAVEETSGQRGVYTFESEAGAQPPRNLPAT